MRAQAIFSGSRCAQSREDEAHDTEPSPVASHYPELPPTSVRNIFGKLFSSEPPKPSDVVQGELSNCPLAASLAAFAAAQPRYVRKQLIVKSGTRVRLYALGRLPVEIPLTGHVLQQGHKRQANWASAVEAAYARFKGVDKLGSLQAEDVLEELTGEPFTTVAAQHPQLWQRLIDRAFLSPKSGQVWESRLVWPATAAIAPPASRTLGEDLVNFFAAIYRTILAFLGQPYYVPNHVYAIVGLGYSEELGNYIKLYNPESQTEGRRDGPKDGFFRVPLKEFCATFMSITLRDC